MAAIQTIQMAASTWETFQSWYTAWEYAAIIEMIVIVALVAYFGRNHLTKKNLIGILEQARTKIKIINESIKHVQYEQWNRKEIPVFGIGKFWVFVISGLFTFIALIGVLVLGYFAVVGENIITYNSPESIQVIAANNLLFRMGFIQDFLWLIFAISLLVIFRDYIELLWKYLQGKLPSIKPKRKIPAWFYIGLRYSILILFTTFAFLALYCSALIVPSSMNGNIELTYNIGNAIANQHIQATPVDQQAELWCNLAAIYEPIAFIFVVFWICSVWLMTFGYLLKYELNYLWKIIKSIPKRVYNFIFASVGGI